MWLEPGCASVGSFGSESVTKHKATAKFLTGAATIPRLHEGRNPLPHSLKMAVG